MKNARATVIDAAEVWEKAKRGCVVGWISRLDEEGRVWVDYNGNARPIEARVTSSVKRDLDKEAGGIRMPVVILFENEDHTLPIVISVINDRLNMPKKKNIAENAFSDSNVPQEAVIDGKRVVLEAENEVILRCGKCSIKLTRDGKISIKGEYVINQAVKANRIKGGSVEIN